MNLLIRLKTILATLVWFGFSPAVWAVSPPPDGGYPNSNTAEGDSALFYLTTGFFNTAIGFATLFRNTTGGGNTANGFQALLSNTTGSGNTANGIDALYANTINDNNTATGGGALQSNNGDNNTANGFDALVLNKTGHDNVAEGYWALEHNTTGSSNIAVGSQAGSNLTTGSNNIDIGALGSAGEANTIRIGKPGTQRKTVIAGIRGVTVASGVGVIVGTTGQLGTVVSSARFKEAIKPMDKASEAILALKPVTFRYKKELDPDKIPQFGLIAEEVEKVNPELVARDEEGKIMSVRYEAVNVMLLNEFLKEHRKNEEQQATITALRANDAKQEATIAQMRKQIEALTARLQKVSAQLEMSKSAPQTVVNNR